MFRSTRVRPSPRRRLSLAFASTAWACGVLATLRLDKPAAVSSGGGVEGGESRSSIDSDLAYARLIGTVETTAMLRELRDLGFLDEDLATVACVSITTIRRWRGSGFQGSLSSERALDDLRVLTALLLKSRRLTPDEAIAWCRRRHPELSATQDGVRREAWADPLRVLAEGRFSEAEFQVKRLVRYTYDRRLGDEVGPPPQGWADLSEPVESDRDRNDAITGGEGTRGLASRPSASGRSGS